MDGRPDELVIVHLRREGAKNRPKVLQSEALNKAWADPMLRYSNILDGLFHDLVVLCEGETDCRFYHAAFDHLWTIRGAGDTPQPSVLFADVGGKDAFKRAAWVLTAFGVPLKVIADFDLLNREGLLSELCLSLGANWEEFKATWRIVSNAIQKKGSAPLQVEELVKNVKEKCANEGKRRLDQNLSDELVAIVRYPSPWSDAKRTGKKIIPPGQETAALESLLDKLRDVGVHVVPEGEVEGWIRIVGGKSMRWLVQVFVEIEAKRVQFPEELLAFLSMVLQLGLKGDSNLPSNDISISSYDSTRSDKQPVNLGPMPAIGIERTFTWRLRRWSFVWIALLLLIFALGVVLFWPF